MPLDKEEIIGIVEGHKTGKLPECVIAVRTLDEIRKAGEVVHVGSNGVVDSLTHWSGLRYPTQNDEALRYTGTNCDVWSSSGPTARVVHTSNNVTVTFQKSQVDKGGLYIPDNLSSTT
jgi:hypothetical protein